MDDKIIGLEQAVAHCEKTIEELSTVVAEQGKRIDALIKSHKQLKGIMEDSGVKPINEEVPPPHYY